MIYGGCMCEEYEDENMDSLFYQFLEEEIDNLNQQQQGDYYDNND